jgi:hypothetical protein
MPQPLWQTDAKALTCFIVHSQSFSAARSQYHKAKARMELRRKDLADKMDELRIIQVTGWEGGKEEDCGDDDGYTQFAGGGGGDTE